MPASPGSQRGALPGRLWGARPKTGVSRAQRPRGKGFARRPQRCLTQVSCWPALPWRKGPSCLMTHPPPAPIAWVQSAVCGGDNEGSERSRSWPEAAQRREVVSAEQQAGPHPSPLGGPEPTPNPPGTGWGFLQEGIGSRTPEGVRSTRWAPWSSSIVECSRGREGPPWGGRRKEVESVPPKIPWNKTRGDTEPSPAWCSRYPPHPRPGAAAGSHPRPHFPSCQRCLGGLGAAMQGGRTAEPPGGQC